MRSPPWRQPSIQGRARHSNGKRPQSHLTNFSDRPTSPLRRPLDSAQYVSIKYTERLVQAGVVPSVGSVGDSYDNALADTINGLYKAEIIHRRGPWRSLTPFAERVI